MAVFPALPVPADEATKPAPSTVLDLVSQAQAKSAAGAWKEAAALWEKVVQLNAVQPGHWYALGNARQRAGDYKGAIPAYEKSAELGGPMMGAYFAIYQIACCRAQMGDKDLAFQALRRAFDLGFPNHTQMVRDPALAPVRDDPRVVELLGLADVTKMSRDEGWRYDLSILAREVHRKGFNPHLYVHRTVTREQFDEKVRTLHEAIPRLTDGQIILELMKLMAFLDDGHTAVWPVGSHPLFKTALPLRFFWFEEGLYVTAADPRYQELLGAQIQAFDGQPTEKILEALKPYDNRDRGNPMKAKVSLPYHVRKLTLLHAAGLIKSPDRVVFTIRDLTGATRDVTVEADTKEPEIWNQLPAPASWVTFASTLKSPPLYVRHMDRAQWFEYLPEHKTVYFQFNGVRDEPMEPLARFTERLLKFVDEHDVERLVIDMRWNNGGNTFLGQPLLLGLIGNKKVNQRGKLFVIIGRRTYSAAQNLATSFERFTQATFVGEPTGSSPNFIGEESAITLPYSKVMGNVSHLFWQTSWPQDQRIWLAPHIHTPPTFADFRAGRDRALEAILHP
jgi:tetratricopeptide (TPR) repeat protein